jgi:hypothetical protein
MNYQFDNTIILNDEAIPFKIIKKDNIEYYYIYAYGNKKFQCSVLRNTLSIADSALLYSMSQKNKINKTYYAKYMGSFTIENKKFLLMKIFFDNQKEQEEKKWDTWLIPKEYTKRINIITHDFDDRSK